MNILQLLPALNIGGVEKGTIEVARYLTLNGHKAVVVSAGGSLQKDLAAVGARHYTIPVGKKNPFVMIYCYFKLKSVIKKENIEIVHARSRVPALIGYFAARSTRTVFITTAHGHYRKHLISRVMGWGRMVIVANETMARYIKDTFDVPRGKLEIIPRGVDPEKFSFAPRTERGARPFRVGMICRFTPLKGHLDFLKAVSYVSRKVNNLEAVIMGDRTIAKEEYLKKIELTIRRLRIGNIVKFVESTEDVADVMNSLDVLVSANSEQEAFGRTVIEAQSRGVPVVATKVGGVVELIDDGHTGLLCEPMDPAAMSEQIVRFANDPGLGDRISRDARRSVEENYTLKKTMAMTLDAYGRALKAKNILIFKISSFGDVVLCSPSIRAVREKFPDANINVLVDVRFREVLDNCPYVDEVITCDLKGRDKGAGFFRLARRLRAKDFDVSIDFQNNRKSHLLGFLCMAQQRYGYDNGKLSFLLNRKIGLPSKPMDPVDHQACVLRLLGITAVKPQLELWPGERSEAWAENFLNNEWLTKGQKVVALSLSASKRWESKNWGISSMVRLTDILAREKGIRVVLVGASEDRDLADEFLKETTAKPIDAVGKTSALQLMSLIKHCDALVAGDSAPMHVAAAVGTPFVAIFGPTDPARHMPPAGRFKVLRKDLRCAPCYKQKCPEEFECMRAIAPSDAARAVMEVMK